jgi:hypothetical protein
MNSIAPTQPPRARGFLRVAYWVGAAAIALAALGYAWRSRSAETAKIPGAYALALDDQSRAGLGWGCAKKLSPARTIAAGEILKIPDRVRVLLVFTDATCELVSGPARRAIPAAPIANTNKLETLGAEEIAERFLAASLSALAKIAPRRAGNGPERETIRVRSPVGVTRFTNPPIAWAAKADTNYDVAVIDPVDAMAPPRLALKTRPPLMLAQLETPQRRRLAPDRLYELHIRESAQPERVGAARFLVTRQADESELPGAPAELLREAVEAMRTKPARLGDACSALAKLPADWAATELAVRLRLRVAADLGLADEFAEAWEAAAAHQP